MIKRLYTMIFGSHPASYPAIGSPADAAERLSMHVQQSVFRTMFTEAIVGKVTVDKVVLSRYRPWIRNSFNPVFRGRFVFLDGRTMLTGVFGLHKFVKIFMSVWFGFLLVFSVLAITMGIKESLRQGISIWVGILSGHTMCAVATVLGLLGCGLVWFGRRISRSDIEYISNSIQEAINPTT